MINWIGGSIFVTHGIFRGEDLNLVHAVILISVGLVLLVYTGRAKKNSNRP